MKENNKKLIVGVLLIVFIGLFAITFLNYLDTSKIIEENTFNLTELISTNVYSEIQLELVKPIYVSLTMANDTFVKEWIQENSEKNSEIIINYLEKIKEKYDYDSSFLISDITKNYYHHSGILKTVSKDDSHDIWYYNTLEQNLPYSLDVDTDQASQNDLTIFINCVIYDEKGDPLGITGVGVKMKNIVEIVKKYNEALGVEAYLISSDGLVQIHAIENFIEEHNIFDNPLYAPYKEELLLERELPNTIEVEKSDKFLISYYIEELDWHLIIEKDTAYLYSWQQEQLLRQLSVFIIAFLILSFLSMQIVNYYQKINFTLASTDSMTGVKNRQAFDEYMDEKLDNSSDDLQPLTIMILDIDNFKQINDTYGHIEGDKCIRAVADLMKQYIKEEDMLARWGGDEFAAAINSDIDGTLQILEKINEAQKENPVFQKYGITISFGITAYREGDNLETLLKRADKALYNAKESGRNRVEIE